MRIEVYGTDGFLEDFMALNGIHKKPYNKYERKRKKTLERWIKRVEKKSQKDCKD